VGVKDIITTIVCESTIVAKLATMPKSFMRGLDLLEAIDVHGPATVTELARVMGRDKSTVSRMLTACEPDGWIVRHNGRVALGPRAALLAHSSAAGELIRRAQPLVEAIAGVTGLMAQAYTLVGTQATVLAAAGARPPHPSVGVKMGTSLVATAAGQVIAAQLDPEKLEQLLPDDPFPDALHELVTNPGYKAFAAGRFVSVADFKPSVPGDRKALMLRLRQVREQGVAIDHADLHPQIGCVAVPWVGATVTAALTCMGTPAEIAAAAERTRAVLQAAAAPGATREDVAAAAAARHYSVAP
jgi:DNA-binding IclR family transcriptional regulator